MAVFDYGFPSRTFFELFAGEHPSEKIYSVQVADWKKYFSKSERAPGQNVQRDVYDAPNTISVYHDTAAVVQVDMDQSLENRASHLKVEPTADLIDFLASRGVDIPDTLYVQPLAFAWSRDGEFEVDEEIVEIPEEVKDDKQKGNSKTTATIAALVAALSFLS